MTYENFTDSLETMIAHLLCSDSAPDENIAGGVRHTKEGMYAAFDAGEALRFAMMMPSTAYTVQSPGTEEENDRLYTTDAALLKTTVQDALGDKAEICLVREDDVAWVGFRRLRKMPKNVWVAKRGASLYEFHYRSITPGGDSFYAKRLAAIDAKGKPVATVITGSMGAQSLAQSEYCIIAASIIEDAHRSGALLASVSQDITIKLPVPLGEHKELFALREAPLTPSGRRKAIVHWVSKHLRKTRTTPTQVQAHWRGVRELSMDGFTVRLETNDL